MEIVADGVEVTGPHGPLLEPTSLRVESGRLLFVTGRAESGRTALALVLSGRMRPRRGTVRLDGTTGTATLRDTVAVVDAPQITEPEPSVPIHHVVAEELSLAGHRSGRRAVREWLSEHRLDGHATQRFENLPTATRTSLLIKLARHRSGIRALVLDSPDRHGGDPLDWCLPAQQEARRGYAVVVLCAPHSVGTLSVTPARLGRKNHIGEHHIDEHRPDTAMPTADPRTPGRTGTTSPSGRQRTEDAR
ncbi:hypothetical protein DFQ14_1164 [Halopolyspora algeriensis]|uniref:ABC transporter family protein n=1 Tax=Halopolyspora algeriensis TaxID=1500506 RepID=A0A368VE97_9ACTN|nr:hypothetical protein [Halopolyspora algeriensis]RCW39519.1 hypothetical protein DFQ14_1164 [Halopolyspora algeriensis]TQM56168.1 hypothetical protein FHU43_0959 [Halopolyspora algeriensis]